MISQATKNSFQKARSVCQYLKSCETDNLFKNNTNKKKKRNRKMKLQKKFNRMKKVSKKKI